jgi:hypothetical protein
MSKFEKNISKILRGSFILTHPLFILMRIQKLHDSRPHFVEQMLSFSKESTHFKKEDKDRF